MRRLLLLLLATAAPLTMQAQTVGTCSPGEATADLSAAGVRARLYNSGGLFWKGSGNVYNVPKAPEGAPVTPNAMFAANAWFGGYVGTDLRMAAATYLNYELWPGPLTSAGQLPNPADCTAHDRIYRVTRADIAAYTASGALSDDLRDWPVSLGAPVIDGDGVAGNYNLAGGDRPEILGTETAWWVMNDVGAPKRSTETKPLGMEIRVSAFALSSNDPAINRSTLYRYTLVYRGTTPLAGAYFGLWMDSDIGNSIDDYVGSDSVRGLAYIYNGDNTDEGTDGYGVAPPALGLRYLEGPLVPAPGQSWTDADGTVHANQRRLGLSGALSIGTTLGNNGNPRNGTTDWYNYLRSLWQNGAAMRACGNGDDTSRPECAPTRFIYSGDPETQQGWSERNLYPGTTLQAHAPYDRKLLASVGPFAMQPGETQSITFGLVYARGSSNLNSVTELKASSDRLQTVWNNGAFFRGSDGTPPPTLATSPTLRTPGNGATGQPSRVHLVWDALDGDLAYEVEVSHEPTFPRDGTVVARSSGPALEIAPDSSLRPYHWRVRGVAASQSGPQIVGPWSETWTFTSTPRTIDAPFFELNFLTVANAAGPLSPPETGIFNLNGSFPQPTGISAIPTERQQSTVNLGSAGWGIHTFGAHTTYTEWLTRTTRDGGNHAEIGPNSFEWRFTGSSVAKRAFDTDAASVGSTMTVPFEIWSLGADLESAADDVRMIPLVCEAACGAGTAQGVFDIGGDHTLSSGANDPITDAVYWHFPSNRAPGQAGYAAWAEAIQRGDPTASGLLGAEAWAHIVLIGWNMGLSPATYRMAVPEHGTVFQIRRLLTAGTAPALTAPGAGEQVSATRVDFRWSGALVGQIGAPTNAPTEFQLARDPGFSELVRHDSLRVDTNVEPHVVRGLTAGTTYYWRVRFQSPALYVPPTPWSAVWSFTPGVASSAEGTDSPIALTLSAVRPNPTRGTARVSVGMPVSGGTARVDVFDVLGRRVAVAHEGILPSGWSEVTLETASLPAGVYVVRLVSERITRSQVLVVAR